MSYSITKGGTLHIIDCVDNGFKVRINKNNMSFVSFIDRETFQRRVKAGLYKPSFSFGGNL